MNVLIIGGGGREHALAWKIGQSPRVERVYVAPGNAGSSLDAINVNIPAHDFKQLIKFAKDNQIGLTIVGPEQPLADGIVDAFQAEKLRIFGPSKAAAELEGSKVFCKNLLRQADVPTADYHVFRSAESALVFVKDREDVPIVVKADGLAAGKGVFVCSGRAEAVDAVNRIGRDKEFGKAGNQILIEERLDGQEASIIAITDGQTIITLAPAQDHKRAFDNDQGPNTGGMGAYSPTPLISDELLRSIEERVLVPTVHAMKRARRPFRGVLYAGLILTNQGPKVLEYNVRFGDPECQPLMMRMKSDLFEVLDAVVEGSLERIDPIEWIPDPAVCVVMASAGYPGKYERNKPIRGLDAAAQIPNVKVFHAATVKQGDQILADGGRVLGVTATGPTIASAKLQAYTAVKAIRWDGAWCRKDIADRAIF